MRTWTVTHDRQTDLTLNRLDLKTHMVEPMGKLKDAQVSGWSQPGKSILLSQRVNGITNVWEYELEGKELTQLTFGQGRINRTVKSPIQHLDILGIEFHTMYV